MVGTIKSTPRIFQPHLPSPYKYNTFYIIHFHQLSFSQPPNRAPTHYLPPQQLPFYIHHLLLVRYYILLIHGSLTYKSAYHFEYSIKCHQLNSGYALRFCNLATRAIILERGF